MIFRLQKYLIYKDSDRTFILFIKYHKDFKTLIKLKVVIPSTIVAKKTPKFQRYYNRRFFLDFTTGLRG